MDHKLYKFSSLSNLALNGVLDTLTLFSGASTIKTYCCIEEPRGLSELMIAWKETAGLLWSKACPPLAHCRLDFPDKLFLLSASACSNNHGSWSHKPHFRCFCLRSYVNTNSIYASSHGPTQTWGWYLFTQMSLQSYSRFGLTRVLSTHDDIECKAFFSASP